MRSRYSKSRLISVLVREAPAVRRITPMPSGTSSSWATSLSRLRSWKLVILRLMPPPRAVVGDLLDGSGLVVGVAVLLGLVLPGRVVLGGGRGRFRVDHLGFEGSGCDLHRVGRFGLAGGRSGRNRLVRRMLRRARGRLRQCDRLDRGLGGDVARCGLARRALVRLAVRALGTVVLDRLAMDRLLALPLGSAPVAWMTVAAIAAAGAAVRFRLGVAMGALFLLDQRLPI